MAASLCFIIPIHLNAYLDPNTHLRNPVPLYGARVSRITPFCRLTRFVDGLVVSLFAETTMFFGSMLEKNDVY